MKMKIMKSEEIVLFNAVTCHKIFLGKELTSCGDFVFK
jgi:hypothetical protein